jgi:membrane-associated protease RseP (regulator of RpoE activity)
MGFTTYDLIFLALFIIFIVVFLYKNRHKTERQGILYLYKTQLGVKFIKKFSDKFQKILKPLQYVIIASGLILMVGIVWILVESLYYYFKLFPLISSATSSPPLVLLLPYTPKIFGLESVLPPLFFTSFLIMFLIIVIPHEFAHGIFMRLNNIGIKSTGFAFLGPILGAFVEQDETDMTKAKKFPQMSVLAAGTFANILTGLVFFAFLTLLFTTSFVPAGAGFSDYASTVVSTPHDLPQNFSEESEFIEIEIQNQKYLTAPTALQLTIEKKPEKMFLYFDSPALRNDLRGAITEFDGEKITNHEELLNAIQSHSPGDQVNIKTAVRNGLWDANPEFREYNIELSEIDGKVFLGISLAQIDPGAIGSLGTRFISELFIKINILNPLVYYESELGDFGWFLFYLLWWIVFANAMVALVNMLPLGIFDGGRFFKLTVESITGSEKIGNIAFQISTWGIIFLVLIMMGRWAFGFF